MMKRFFMTMVAIVAAAFTLTSCDKEDDTFVDFSALPAAAQTLVTTHFDKDDILFVVFDKELINHEYTVSFNDTTVIEFDKKGEWESIEAKQSGVPMAIIPEAIATYLKEKFADKKVTQIERDTKGYEVEIELTVELKFDLNGKLIGADL